MINLFFMYYDSKSSKRQQEIDECLSRNVKNDCIDQIFVLIDDGSELTIESKKLNVIKLKSRPTYRKWLELTSELDLSGVSIMCNSDIYFDNTLSDVKGMLSQDGNFLALSRWEKNGEDMSLHKAPQWSQDVWGVSCDSKFSNRMLQELDFQLGVPRCDNKIAYIFSVRGWRVYNPCGVIKSIHLHETQLRTYNKKLNDELLGGVAYVYPTNNILEESRLDFDVWSKRLNVVNKVTLNKSMQKWIEGANRREELDRNDGLVKVASSIESLESLKAGEIVASPFVNGRIISYNKFFYFYSIYVSRSSIKIDSSYYESNKKDAVVAGFFPPVLGLFTKEVGSRAKNADDLNFWQYPCATEEQAYLNHCAIKNFSHIDVQGKVVNLYVPLPWATYIDKKGFPEEYLLKVAKAIARFQLLASQCDYSLNVHTVCQHIHWVRIVEKAKEVGITDLHLSHKNSSSEQAQADVGVDLLLHGWPLIAVNYETESRRDGMERKPMNRRKLLASFIGAHMKHYLDDSRVQMFEAAKSSGRNDILVDLGNEWHFNKVVYDKQVLNKELSKEYTSEELQKTFRYNSILSDSKFSLCPVGAGPNTLRLWESISVGSIPVVFSSDLDIIRDLDNEYGLFKYLVVWEKGISPDLFEYLAGIHDLDWRSRNLIAVYEDVVSRKVFSVA